jgi:hypothetical protein
VTIGELFVKLGFKVEGAGDFKKVAADLKDNAAAAGKLAIGIDAIMAGFTGMMYLAMQAGTTLQKFHLTTGLSTDELQRWRFAAAGASVAANELDDAVKQIQMAGMKASATGEGVGAWYLLGIDPRQNPFTILRQLNQENHSVDQTRVAAARYIAEQAGFGANIFQMLRGDLNLNTPAGSLVSPDDAKRLYEMNGEWNQMKLRIEAAGERFAVVFKPAFEDFIGVLSRLLEKTGGFFDFLNSGSAKATEMNDNINTLAKTFGMFAIALSAVALAAKGVALSMNLIGAATGPVGAAILAIMTVIGLSTDFSNLPEEKDDAHKGGMSMDEVREEATKTPSKQPSSRAARYMREKYGQIDRLNDAPPSSMRDWIRLSRESGAFSLNRTAPAATTVQQTNTFNINGAQSPEATGLAVGSHIQRMLRDASNNVPAAAY